MKKYLFFFLGLILIISITLFHICDEDTFLLMIKSIENINLKYLFIMCLNIIIYFFLQGIYTKVILNSLGTKISLFKGTFYAMIEFYFSGITPSSSGGQPAQLYFMSKDKIPGTNTTITLILNTIFFKLILVILGIWVLIFNNEYIFNYLPLYIFLFFIGLIFDILLIVLCFLLLFNQSFIKKVLKKFFKVLKKIPIIKKYIEKININEVINNYNKQASYIKKNKKEVFFTFIITFMQRLILWSFIFLVYRGLGFNEMSYFDLLAIQITVQMAIEFLPIPGGAIISETMLRDSFVGIFGIGMAEVGMIFTRSFNFYIPLIFCFVIILTSIIKNRKKYL